MVYVKIPTFSAFIMEPWCLQDLQEPYFKCFSSRDCHSIHTCKIWFYGAFDRSAGLDFFWAISRWDWLSLYWSRTNKIRLFRKSLMENLHSHQYSSLLSHILFEDRSLYTPRTACHVITRVSDRVLRIVQCSNHGSRSSFEEMASNEKLPQSPCPVILGITDDKAHNSRFQALADNSRIDESPYQALQLWRMPDPIVFIQ